MTYFTWNDGYSVGITSIDNDHKVLIDLIDQLHEASLTGHVRETCAAVLDSLVDYTERHFRREEDLLRQCSYPELPEHHRQHETLAAQVIDIRDRFVRGEQDIGITLLAFLHDWLYFHIMETDMAYRGHFAAAGLTDGPAGHS